jgi:site-specific DNA-adenine methylase
MSTVSDLYKIQFIKKLFINEYIKTMNSPHGALNQFITDYPAPDYVNNYVISEISKVLNGTVSAATIISQSMVTVEISASVSNFYFDPDYLETDTPDFSLPTNDFKGIAEAWLNYLQSN